MRTRRLERRDREAVAAILQSDHTFDAGEVSVALELVDSAIDKPTGDYQALVLADADAARILGYVCYGRTPMTASTWDLYWIATRTDRMGKGYGRAILSFVEEEVRRRGGYLLVIETSSQESYGSTRQFYDKVGCTLAAQLPDYYAEGDDKLIYLKRVR